MRTFEVASISAPFSISTRIAFTCPPALAAISAVLAPCHASGKRVQVRGAGGDASDGARVGSMHVCPCIMCDIQQDRVRITMCSTLLD
jgi:hypothetical protein